MTRRERLERKLEKREEWAESRRAKATDAYQGAREIGDRIPMGQPILSGHHSERGHRRDLERIDRKMGASVEHSKMAAHHDDKAAGLAAQLDRSIYDDDPDAVEQLEARIAEREAAHKAGLKLNRQWRKAGKPDPLVPEEWAAMVELAGEESAALAARELRHQRRGQGAGLFSWAQPYSTTNAAARIRNDKQRLERVRAQQARSERAERAGGVAIEPSRWDGHVCVTFAEKPDRSILDDLRAAGYRWAKGSWVGPADALPASVRELV